MGTMTVRYQYRQGLNIGYPFHATTKAWEAEVIRLGGSVSYARKRIVDTLISGLDADGVLSKLDRLWLFDSETQIAAYTDLIALSQASPGAFGGNPTFVADAGFAGNGSAMNVETNFNPAVGTNKFLPDDACYFCWDNTGGAETGGLCGQLSQENRIFINYDDGSDVCYWNINDNAVVGTAPATAEAGLYLANRTGANTATLDVNGVETFSDVFSSTSFFNGQFYVLRAAGGTQYSAHTASIFGIGGGLTAPQRVALNDRIQTYKAAIKPLLLDAIDDVSFAFSFRRLRSDYHGYCCKIRRSSDNAERDFGFVNNVVDTAHIATFIGGGTGYVSVWYNQGNSPVESVFNVDTATQPEFAAVGTNGLPSLRYDKSLGQYLRTDSFTFVEDIFNYDEATIIVVAEPTSSDFYGLVTWDNGGNTRAYLLTFGGSFFWRFGDYTFSATYGVDVAEPGSWVGNPHIVEAFRTPANEQAIVYDGATIVTATTLGSIGPGNVALLSIGNYIQSFDGDISEVIVARTGAIDRTTIRKIGVGAGVAQSLAGYYGITVA